MTIQINTVTPPPVPQPETFDITGLTLDEVRAIRTLFGECAASPAFNPSYRLFKALSADSRFPRFRLETRGPASRFIPDAP